jgi:hypothetical protein
MGVLAVLPTRGEPRYFGGQPTGECSCLSSLQVGEGVFLLSIEHRETRERSLNAHTRGTPRYDCKDPETATQLTEAALQELLRFVLRVASCWRTEVVYNQAHQLHLRHRHARLSGRRLT